MRLLNQGATTIRMLKTVCILRYSWIIDKFYTKRRFLFLQNCHFGEFSSDCFISRLAHSVCNVHFWWSDDDSWETKKKEFMHEKLTKAQQEIGSLCIFSFVPTKVRSKFKITLACQAIDRKHELTKTQYLITWGKFQTTSICTFYHKSLGERDLIPRLSFVFSKLQSPNVQGSDHQIEVCLLTMVFSRDQGLHKLDKMLAYRPDPFQEVKISITCQSWDQAGTVYGTIVPKKWYVHTDLPSHPKILITNRSRIRSYWLLHMGPWWHKCAVISIETILKWINNSTKWGTT